MKIRWYMLVSCTIGAFALFLLFTEGWLMALVAYFGLNAALIPIVLLWHVFFPAERSDV